MVRRCTLLIAALLPAGCGPLAELDTVASTSALESTSGTVLFQGDWSEVVQGSLRQGGTLDVHYALERLSACRGTHNGYPAWDLVGTARFSPGGQEVEGSVRALGNELGRPTNEASTQLWSMPIPDDATGVELWFRNFTGAGSSCQAWDSNWGANYRFEVWPAPEDPRCRDVERETGVHSEADEMVHHAPACLPYDLDAQVDATHCELWVEGFGDGYVGHYGIPYGWLVGYLHVGTQEGELLGVGMYTRFHDRQSGTPGERYSLGEQVAAATWKVGFRHTIAGMGGQLPVDAVADELAFFLDVRRPGGQVVRLWASRGGANYRVDEIFAPGVIGQGIPYGSMRWAREESVVFDSRRACR